MPDKRKVLFLDGLFCQNKKTFFFKLHQQNALKSAFLVQQQSNGEDLSVDVFESPRWVSLPCFPQSKKPISIIIDSTTTTSSTGVVVCFCMNWRSVHGVLSLSVTYISSLCDHEWGEMV